MMGCGMSQGSDAARTSDARPKWTSLPTTPAGGAPTPSDNDSAWSCAHGAGVRLLLPRCFGGVGGGGGGTARG